MAKKKNIWEQKFAHARMRDDRNPADRQKSREREAVARATTLKTLNNTAVDAYSMKVTFNAI